MDQPSYRKRPSIFWPLMLIAIGVIFLLDNLNIIPGTIWDIIARYWPVIFILISLENLVRGESFFGPIFTIGTMIIFQLSILGTITWDIWEIIIRFWPVVIIVLGLDILLGRGEKRSVPGMILGLIVIAAILAGIAWYTGFGPGRSAVTAATSEVINVPLESTQKADVTITAPLAILSVGSGTASDKLAEGSISLSKSNSIKQMYDVQGDQGVLTLATSSVTTFTPGITRAGAEWTVRLNEAVPMDLTVSSVFSKTNLDMEKFTFDSLKLDNVFSSTAFSLPAAGGFEGTINNVFSTLTLEVPEGAAVVITVDGFLSPTDLPAGYVKEGNRILSPAAAAGASGIILNTDLAFATLKIVAVP